MFSAILLSLWRAQTQTLLVYQVYKRKYGLTWPLLPSTCCHAYQPACQVWANLLHGWQYSESWVGETIGVPEGQPSVLWLSSLHKLPPYYVVLLLLLMTDFTAISGLLAIFDISFSPGSLCLSLTLSEQLKWTEPYLHQCLRATWQTHTSDVVAQYRSSTCAILFPKIFIMYSAFLWNCYGTE